MLTVSPKLFKVGVQYVQVNSVLDPCPKSVLGGLSVKLRCGGGEEDRAEGGQALL